MSEKKATESLIASGGGFLDLGEKDMADILAIDLNMPTMYQFLFPRKGSITV
jgi:hypothetical protein